MIAIFVTSDIKGFLWCLTLRRKHRLSPGRCLLGFLALFHRCGQGANLNISLRKSDFDVGSTEVFVDFVVDLALRLGKALVGSKLVDSSK